MDEEKTKGSQNPLECGVCQKEFNNPVHLPCLHVFCNGCIGGEAGGTSPRPLCCPECQEPLGESPPIDLLAKYLVDTAHEPAEVCANCDQIAQPMFFCETCQQALCVGCRQNTHQAKMFSTHRMISLEERARVRGRVSCAQHGEPYILYCVDEKRLVCIQCFNGRPLESRHSFVSIETAHAGNVEKMEKWVNKLRLYQLEKREEVDVRKRMLAEVEERFSRENSAITQLCQDIHESVNFVRDTTLEQMGLGKKELEADCRAQMAELNSLMAPIRLYLLSSQILCSSASKIDFLQFYADLVKRIQVVLGKSIGRPPLLQWKDIDSIRAELAKALEPHIGMSAAWMPPPAREAREGSGSASYKGNRSLPQHGFQGVLTKYQIMVDLAGAFGEHFARIDMPLKDLSNELADLSKRVQEAQRDLTRRKVLLKPSYIEALIERCATVDSRLGMHSAVISELQPDLQELWQEALDRVRRQQIMYREKVELSMRLRETARQVLTAVKQLAPFAKCLESMSATIDPKRCHPPDPAPMERICLQISTLEPDSERRIQAIEEEENNRRVAQEQKRRQEEEQRSAVGKLHKAKGKKKATPLLMISGDRERSPGGTDSMLISPLVKSPQPTICCGNLSDQTYDSEDELPGPSNANSVTFALPLQNEPDSSLFDSRAMRSPSPTTVKNIGQLLLSLTQNKPEIAVSPTPTESDWSVASQETEELERLKKISESGTMKGKSKRAKEPVKEMPIPTIGISSDALAGRITANVENSRDTVLRALHDVFSERAEEDTVVVERPNVLASAVKEAEKRLKEKEPSKTGPSRPTGSRRKTVSISETMAEVKLKEEEDGSLIPRPNSTPVPLPPPLPPNHPEPEQRKKEVVLKPFEAREKVQQRPFQMAPILRYKCFNCPSCDQPFESQRFLAKTPMIGLTAGQMQIFCRDALDDVRAPAHWLIDLLAQPAFEKKSGGYIMHGSAELPRCPGCDRFVMSVDTRRPHFLMCGHLICEGCLATSPDNLCFACNAFFGHDANPLCKPLVAFAAHLLSEKPADIVALLLKEDAEKPDVPLAAYMECGGCELQMPIGGLIQCNDCSVVACGSCFIRDHKEHDITAQLGIELSTLHAQTSAHVLGVYEGYRKNFQHLHASILDGLDAMVAAGVEKLKDVTEQHTYDAGKEVADLISQLTADFETQCELYMPVARKFNDHLIDVKEQMQMKEPDPQDSEIANEA
ncbi:unnamed protein product, partial [Mesorhabditis spiculigera]